MAAPAEHSAWGGTVLLLFCFCSYVVVHLPGDTSLTVVGCRLTMTLDWISQERE